MWGKYNHTQMQNKIKMKSIRTMCKSKISRATITELKRDYEGSITIDQKLMDTADILPNEKVQIVNLNNGNRIETYVIPGERRSGTVCLNGASAMKGSVGDVITIASYILVDEQEARELLSTLADKLNVLY